MPPSVALMVVDDNNECIQQSEQLPLILALQVDQVRRAH